jgi:PAS domain S-box-containing protein
VGTPLQQVLLNVYHTGEPYEINELLIPVAETEGGSTQNRYFSFNYQARRDENDEIDGILTFVFEVTTMVTEKQNQLAMNEELAAINEEYQATNEELMQMQLAFKQKNDELGESKSRLQMAVETTALGTWDHHIPEDDLFLSDEGRAIFGFPGGDQVNFGTMMSLVHHEDNTLVGQSIQDALAGDGRYDVTCRIIRAADGAERWLRIRGNMQMNSTGGGERNIATFLDITESKLAEEKSAKLAAIVQSSDDAIISKTLESVITSWNDSAERMFGYTADEIIGQTIYKLIPPDRYEEEPKILARLRTGERVEHFETRRWTKDGRELDVSLTISPMKDDTGHIIGLSKIIRDITERKQNETRKNDFIGMVSHELKTPLTSLTAIIQVANHKLRGSEDSFLVGAMGKAHVQVKRMTAMINGFLNVSRLESGKMLIEKEDFELDKFIVEIIEETKLVVSSHDILFNNCDPVTVHADRDKISSVISNLLSNAVKYSPKGKIIEVNCMVIGSEVQVSIRDEGMGIKPRDLEQIFGRYYRVEANNTRHISGFGIGLYLSAEIIQRHNGRIWAESESGIGSVFYFSLPLI